jgi:hypothetical protein
VPKPLVGLPSTFADNGASPSSMVRLRSNEPPLVRVNTCSTKIYSIWRQRTGALPALWRQTC